MASLIANNVEHHALPELAADIRRVPDLGPDAPGRYEGNEYKLFWGVSAPGYSSSSDAVVYTFNRGCYRCGEGWVIVLRKVGETWQVKGTFMVWIS